jgi:carbon storage regulator
MLILSRKTSESIIIDGRILVKIVRIEGGMVKVGIDAPSDVPVHRQEVFDEIQRNNVEALTRGRPALPKYNGPQAKLEAAPPPPAAPPTNDFCASTDGDKADATRPRKTRTSNNPRTTAPGQTEKKKDTK